MSRGVVDLGDVSFLIMAASASSEHHCDQISLTGTYVPELLDRPVLRPEQYRRTEPFRITAAARQSEQ